jgi:iron complex transport system substrate-binding protein
MKKLGFLLVAVIIMASLVMEMTGCTSAAPTATTRTITDMTGRTVVVPTTINRVVTAFMPSYETVFILGGQDKIVATGGAQDKRNKLAVKINPAYATYTAITALGMAANLNIEEMINVNPDVVFFWPNPPVLQKLEEAGIPSIVFFSFSVPDSFTGYKDQQKNEITFMADLLGGNSPKIAKEYCKYYDEKLDYLYDKTKDLTDAQRPRFFIGNSTGANILNGWSKNMEENYMDWIAGGSSMTAKADETSAGGFTQVNKEALLDYNPEYIVVDNHGGNTQAIQASVIADPAFSELSAVKNGRVYTVPVGVFLMNHGPEKPLYMLWLAKTIQPELFKDLDFNKEIKYFYDKFYNYQLSDDEISQILSGSFK